MTSQTNREIAEGIVAQWRSEPIHKDDFDIELLDAITQALDQKDSKALSGPSDEQKADFIKARIEYFEDGDEVDLKEYLNECIEFVRDNLKQSPPLTAENLLPDKAGMAIKALDVMRMNISPIAFIDWIYEHVSEKLKGVVK